MGLNPKTSLSHFKLFLLALSFYTRLPCLPSIEYKPNPRANVYLPAVGWIVGGVSGVVCWLALQLWSPNTAIILTITTGVLMTGALHEDGFADVCDGFGGGYGKQQILDIMKDPQIGVYGVIGLLLLYGLKINLLSDMPTAKIPLVILTGQTISRLMPLLLMERYSYARDGSSKIASIIFKPNVRELLLASIFAIWPFALLPLTFLFTIIPVLIVNALLGRYFYRHIGGYTGDCLGASQQLAESVFYLSCGALWTFI